MRWLAGELFLEARSHFLLAEKKINFRANFVLRVYVTLNFRGLELDGGFLGLLSS